MQGRLGRAILDGIQQAQARRPVYDGAPLKGTGAGFQAGHTRSKGVGLHFYGASRRRAGNQIGQGMQGWVVRVARRLADRVINSGQFGGACRKQRENKNR